jgi:hypothetical protein
MKHYEEFTVKNINFNSILQNSYKKSLENEFLKLTKRLRTLSRIMKKKK